MKKVIVLIALFTWTWQAGAQNKKLKVVTTCSILEDMTKNIIGDQVELLNIVPVGGDPHLYEPTPRDARLAASADLVIKNGLTFEGWLNELIENSGTKAKTITVTDGVKVIKSQDYENSADPHAWMDAANALVYIKNIKDAMVELNPDNREVYEFNYGVYKKQLEELDQYILQEIKKIPSEKRVVITSHDAFQYYGKKYGIELEAILGTSTDAEAQTSDIKRLHDVIEQRKIPAIFVESTINPKMLEGIAQDNDIQVGGELFADSLGDEDSGAGTYIDMLRQNTDVIVKALTRKTGDVAASQQTQAGSSSASGWITWGLLGALMLGGFIFVLTRLNK